MSNQESLDRRDFLTVSAAACAAVALGGALTPRAVSAEGEGSFELPKLPYAPEALEPHLDKQTMELHHGKHHATYVKNLNTALKDQPDLARLKIEELLADGAQKIPESIRQNVINNGGGHANHTLFWTTLIPSGSKLGGDLESAIKATFGGQEQLAEKMNDAGLKRFGSGWSWLVKGADGKLEVYSTANQDSPIMKGHTPLLGIDVWEHAYYLKYQNRRADYLKAIWNVVHWDAVGKRFAEK